MYVTINRADKLNALNKQTISDLANVVQYVADTAEVRGVILTGAGEKAFVAGADITEFSGLSREEAEDLARTGQSTVFDEIEKSTKPFIAAINGFALGGGLELAMACHIRIASSNARLGLPEVTLGLIPGYGGTQRLTQLVGKGRAFEIIATADMITAEKAEKIGLVNYAVPVEELFTKSKEILNKINLRAPLAVSAAIAATNAAFQPGKAGYDLEINAFADCFTTEDFKEGVAAFLEKRPANFRGK